MKFGECDKYYNINKCMYNILLLGGLGGGFEGLVDLENHFIQFAEITFIEIKNQAVQIGKFVVFDFNFEGRGLADPALLQDIRVLIVELGHQGFGDVAAKTQHRCVADVSQGVEDAVIILNIGHRLLHGMDAFEQVEIHG